MWVCFCNRQRRVIKIHSSRPLPTCLHWRGIVWRGVPAWVFRLDAASGSGKRLHPVEEIEGLDRKISLATEKPPEVNLRVLPSVMTIGGHGNNPGRWVVDWE